MAPDHTAAAAQPKDAVPPSRLRRWFGRGAGPAAVARNGAAAAGSHLIALAGVEKAFDTAAGTFYALRGVDLTVDGGEFVAVVGKSGSGKSTLINMITGIDRPTAGTVEVAGTAVHRLSEGQLAVWRGRQLGIVFQFFQLMPTLTTVENVMLPMDFAGLGSRGQRRERALELLSQVGLDSHADKLPSELSGGEQQRVAIARALANDPPLVVADEPTGNLDSRTAAAIFRLFGALVDAGKTIVIVTHDIDLARRVDRTITLSDGRIVGDARNHGAARRMEDEDGALEPAGARLDPAGTGLDPGSAGLHPPSAELEPRTDGAGSAAAGLESGAGAPAPVADDAPRS